MRNFALILALVLSSCATQKVAIQSEGLSETELFLDNGIKQLSESNVKKAISNFDKVILLCENQYSSKENKFYASRGTTETIFYMMKAAIENESAVAVGPVCSEALYFRGYASLDLGQIDLAEEFIKRAIDMAPVNSMYLSELGHIYHSKRNWESALKVFIQAEEAATTYTPPELKEAELSRAMRGVGYSLIELGKLDEAEEKFRACLDINNNDEGAVRELKYIEEIRRNEAERSK